jgi:hypothetical protein
MNGTELPSQRLRDAHLLGGIMGGGAIVAPSWGVELGVDLFSRGVTECGVMNDNDQMTREEREQLEQFRAHQARFEERRFYIGFCRWMKMRFAPATVDKPRQPPVSLQAARASKSRRSSDASQEPAD